MAGKRKNNKAAGTRRELQVKHQEEAKGWELTRSPASIGVADLMAVKRGHRSRLIQVKANKDGGPYKNFQPAERLELVAAAERVGAQAWLVWWPPNGEQRWIHSSEWPRAAVAA